MSQENFAPALVPEKELPKPLRQVVIELNSFNEKFALAEYVHRPVCLPGIGDVFIRQISRLGYKGEYPRPYDWENLIPQLREGEELLWIVRKRGGSQFEALEDQTGCVGVYAFEVYLGLKFTDDAPTKKDEWINRGRRFASLTRHFAKSAFPESQLCQSEEDPHGVGLLREIDGLAHRRIVAGMPSIKDVDLKDVAGKRDDKIRPYAGLNDFLEMHGGPADNFAIVFSVARVSDGVVQHNFDALFIIQNTIAPLVKATIQKTKGSSEGWSLTETVTKSDSSSDQIDGGEKKYVRKRGLIPRMKRGLGNVWRWVAGTPGSQAEELDNRNWVRKIGVTKTSTESQATAKATNGSTNESESCSITQVNAKLSFVEERVKECLQQLTQTLGTGGYACGAVVYAASKFTSESVANAICATMSGGHSALNPMRVYEFDMDENRDWLIRKKSLATVMMEDGIQAGILNCEKACLYLPVPTTHLVGLPLKKNVFYGKERAELAQSLGVEIGSMSFAETHVLDEHTSFFNQNNHLRMQLSQEDFYSHLFVVGTTGCGKTTRAAKILREADGFRRVILETAKKTYWGEIGLAPRQLCVYTLGDSTHHPLRFNPFFFEEGTSLKQHIAVLADAISDLLPMEALIGPKLREAVERSYRLCGWDIESSTHEDVGCSLKYPNVAMFNVVVKQIADEMSDYGDEVRGNYKGALLNRAGIFMDAVYQDIFAFDGNKTIDEMFPPDKTIIIEMEEMPPSEINMPAFVVSLLLQRIRSYQNRASKRGDFKGKPGFLIAIEEAHNVLAKSFQEKGDESKSGKGGHLVRQVSRLLAEGRGLRIGMMIIDQSAVNIAPSVITNTNTKLVFRQEDGSEIEAIGKAIGLDEKSWSDLQLLERGEYLLRNGRYPQPVKMAPLSADQIPCFGGVNREDYVAGASNVPRYHKSESLVRDYCNGKGRVRTSDGFEFVGLEGKRFSPYEARLMEVCGQNKELADYVKIKTLIGFGYYATAEKVIGI